MRERTSDADLVHPLFLERWSPRSFSDDPVTDEELAALFEAARWTPSWFNNQPWYYLYETDGPHRQDFLDVFLEANRRWASAAPVVGLVLARTELEDFMARSRDFDTGAATMALIIQATMLDLSVHLLGGIDLDAAHELTGVDPADAKIICGFVIGRRGSPDQLDERLQAREQPSPRKPVADFAIRGIHLPS